jgi:hypothetical protein
MDTINFIKAHLPLVLCTAGIAVIGYLGYHAVRWIIDKCSKTEKIDGIAQKIISTAIPVPKNITSIVQKNVLYKDVAEESLRHKSSVCDFTELLEKLGNTTELKLESWLETWRKNKFPMKTIVVPMLRTKAVLGIHEICKELGISILSLQGRGTRYDSIEIRSSFNDFVDKFAKSSVLLKPLISRYVDQFSLLVALSTHEIKGVIPLIQFENNEKKSLREFYLAVLKKFENNPNSKEMAIASEQFLARLKLIQQLLGGDGGSASVPPND